MNMTICICCIIGSVMPQNLCMGVTPIRKIAIQENCYEPSSKSGSVSEEDGERAEKRDEAGKRNENRCQWNALRSGEANRLLGKVGKTGHQKDQNEQQSAAFNQGSHQEAAKETATSKGSVRIHAGGHYLGHLG
jgi:hypothetical protein